METGSEVADVEKEISQKLIKLQREDIEKELEDMMLTKKSKGRSAAIFSNLKKICGDKKANQEQVAMKDPKTNLEVYEPNIIKTVSLEYCVNLLNVRNFYDEHKDYYYLQDMIHLLRCRDDSRDDSELTKEDFEKRLKILNTKCKEKYKYI